MLKSSSTIFFSWGHIKSYFCNHSVRSSYIIVKVLRHFYHEFWELLHRQNLRRVTNINRKSLSYTYIAFFIASYSLCWFIMACRYKSLESWFRLGGREKTAGQTNWDEQYCFHPECSQGPWATPWCRRRLLHTAPRADRPLPSQLFIFMDWKRKAALCRLHAESLREKQGRWP